MEAEVFRDGDIRGQPAQGAGGRERQAAPDCLEADAGDRRPEGSSRKKMVGPSHKRAAVKVLQDKGLSVRAACRLVGLDRTTLGYVPVPPKDGELRSLVKELAAKYRRAGYRRIGRAS